MAETVCPTPQICEICGICGFNFGIWVKSTPRAGAREGESKRKLQLLPVQNRVKAGAFAYAT